jgi:hypothetical protein
MEGMEQSTCSALCIAAISEIKFTRKLGNNRERERKH